MVPVARLRLFAAGTPLVIYGLYFADLRLTSSTWWSIHFWAGAIFMASAVRLLVSYLLVPPISPDRPEAASRPLMPELTFAFVDLDGFTALIEVHGDDGAADLIERFVEISRQALAPPMHS